MLIEIAVGLLCLSALALSAVAVLQARALDRLDGYVLILEDRVRSLESFLNLPHD